MYYHIQFGGDGGGRVGSREGFQEAIGLELCGGRREFGRWIWEVGARSTPGVAHYLPPKSMEARCQVIFREQCAEQAL